MNAALPKYMSIKDFCAYSGFSRYQFMRLADKAGIPVLNLGTGMGGDWRSRMVDVAEALRRIEALSESDKEVPIYLEQNTRYATVEEAEQAAE